MLNDLRALRKCVKAGSSCFTHGALQNAFCPNCEGWGSPFALDSGMLFLEARRVLLPPTDACDFAHLLPFLQGEWYLLLFAVPQCSANLRLVKCIKSKRGSPLNTVQHSHNSCASSICLFVTGLSWRAFMPPPISALCHTAQELPTFPALFCLSLLTAVVCTERRQRLDITP